jgi:hypothetical protein
MAKDADLLHGVEPIVPPLTIRCCEALSHAFSGERLQI